MKRIPVLLRLGTLRSGLLNSLLDAVYGFLQAITFILDAFLSSDAVIRNYTLGLRLRAFLAFHIARVSQATSLAFPAVQTSSLLLFALLRRIGAGWRPVFHVNVELETRFEDTPMAAKKDV